MPSGVAADRFVSNLYLDGSKASILVTAQRSNYVRIHPQFMSHEQHSTFQPQTSLLGGNNVNRFYSGHETDKDGSLPRVDGESFDGKCRLATKHMHTATVTDDGGFISVDVVEPLLLAPETQTFSSLTIAAPEAHYKENLNFGNLDREPTSLVKPNVCDCKGMRVADQPALPSVSQCDTCQTHSQSQTSRASGSGSGSCKENISPHPPSEHKKKKVKRRSRKFKTVKPKRHTHVSTKKAVSGSRNANYIDSGDIQAPATAPASTQKAFGVSCQPVVVHHYSHGKPATAQSTPDFPRTCAQRHEVSSSIYMRRGHATPYRSGTLPVVGQKRAIRPKSSDLPNSQNTASNVIRVRLADSSLEIQEDGVAHLDESLASQRWGRLVKIYLSEPQSGSMRDADGVTEYPCAPPATPTAEQLRRYTYVPCMNDVKAQRAVKCRLHALEKAEQKRLEKQKGRNTKAELQAAKANQKALKQRQRQEIYALNSVMTDLEYNRFVAFCLSQGIQPN